MTLTIKRLQGKEIESYLSDLATLRMRVFHDYPYLYEGELEYEKKYLHKFAHETGSVLIIVLDDDKVVGASTALPLKAEKNEVKAPFLKLAMNIDDIFYLSESVLLPEYRGQHIGKTFFAEREKAACEQGYKIATFCAIERDTNDPKQPKNWHSLDTFWQNQGYTKHPELITYFSWKEIGETKESLKPMIFWIKQLRNQ